MSNTLQNANSFRFCWLQQASLLCWFHTWSATLFGRYPTAVISNIWRSPTQSKFQPKQLHHNGLFGPPCKDSSAKHLASAGFLKWGRFHNMFSVSFLSVKPENHGWCYQDLFFVSVGFWTPLCLAFAWSLCSCWFSWLLQVFSLPPFHKMRAELHGGLALKVPLPLFHLTSGVSLNILPPWDPAWHFLFSSSWTLCAFHCYLFICLALFKSNTNSHFYDIVLIPNGRHNITLETSALFSLVLFLNTGVNQQSKESTIPNCRLSKYFWVLWNTVVEFSTL